MQWKGQWLWLPEDQPAADTYMHARRVFEVGENIRRAHLSITASQAYRVWVNGTWVGRGPDRADPAFPYFDGYDVSALLQSGSNLIAVEAYAVSEEADRGRSWVLCGGAPGLLAQLEWEDGRGPGCMATDEAWRVIRSPYRRLDPPLASNFLGFVEDVDGESARTFGRWWAADYDDASWHDPRLLGSPPNGPVGSPLAREQSMLVPREHVPVEMGGVGRSGALKISPPASPEDSPGLAYHVAAPPDAPAAVTVRFHRTMGGMPRIELDHCRGGNLEIHYGENTREVLCDRLTLPREGAFTYEPMGWRGCRSMTLWFRDLPEPVLLRAVRLVEWVYPFIHTGDFEADDPLPGRIWRMCRETAEAGVKDHPQDCAHREQALWVADLWVHARAAAVCFGDLMPFEKACRQALRNVREDGILPVPGPCGTGYDMDGEVLRWSEQPLTVPMTVMRIVEHTGDAELARFAAPAVRRMMIHFGRYEDERGLIQVDKPGMQRLQVFTGWAGMLKDEGVPLNVNGEYVLSLRASADLLRLADDEVGARALEQRAGRAASAAARAFYAPADHLFIDGETASGPSDSFSPTANAWAVLAGLLPAGEAGAWGWAMERHVQVGDVSSPFDASLLLEAYLELGLEDPARRLLEACWGAFVDRGEPCVPERWQDGHRTMRLYGYGDAASRCHPYGTGPAFALLRYVAGIRPLAPGYRRLRVKPLALGYRTARGRVRAAAGDVSVYWRRERGEWMVEVELPSGVEAEVVLPRPDWGAARMVCDGATVWSDDGWRRYRDARQRCAHRDTTHEVAAAVAGPGRHVCVMETC